MIVGSLSRVAVAQDASSLLSSGMLGWQDNAVSDLISGTDITGYIDTSYTFNFNDDAIGVAVELFCRLALRS